MEEKLIHVVIKCDHLCLVFREAMSIACKCGVNSVNALRSGIRRECNDSTKELNSLDSIAIRQVLYVVI